MAMEWMTALFDFVIDIVKLSQAQGNLTGTDEVCA